MSPEVPTAPRRGSRVDQLLPPEAPDLSLGEPAPDVAPRVPWVEPQGDERPKAPAVVPVSTRPRKEEPVILRTADGGYVAVDDSVKTVRVKGEEVELRRLTPEEKARRRFRRNVVMWAIGALLLILTTAILLNV